jgi:sterol 3beta-glucosyltransferase
VVNRWRREVLKLPPGPRSPSALVHTDGRPMPVLLGYSAHVFPRPADFPAQASVAGFWFLDQPADWSPSPELLAFLEAGPPPAYIGFGSMAGRNPERLTRAALEAVAAAGCRAVLATGWGGLTAAEAPAHVHFLEAVPHNGLFPQGAAVVHPGGAGTTGAGLRAGRTTVVCPLVGDQPFWGRRVAALGAGPAPLSKSTLTAERLAEAISTAVTDSAMRQRAEALGQRIRAEDGVARAIGYIHAHPEG